MTIIRFSIIYFYLFLFASARIFIARSISCWLILLSLFTSITEFNCFNCFGRIQNLEFSWNKNCVNIVNTAVKMSAVIISRVPIQVIVKIKNCRTIEFSINCCWFSLNSILIYLDPIFINNIIIPAKYLELFNDCNDVVICLLIFIVYIYIYIWWR